MKRIAVVSTSYPFDAEQAGGHFVRREVEELVAAGNQVTVFAPHAREPTQPGNPELIWLTGHSAFGAPGVLPRLRAAPWRVVPLSRFVVQARRALRTAPFDEVIGHWILPVACPLLCGLDAATEVVVHGSDLRLFLQPPALRPFTRSALRRVSRRLAERGTVLRFVSHALRDEFRGAVGAAATPLCTVVPSPIDVPRLEREQERSKLGILDREFVALIVGRLIPGKRVEHALRFAATLAPRVRCVVVGDGPLRAQLARRYPEAEFLGELPRPQTLGWICAADALVTASLSEGAPTVIREARALGTCVWTANVGDVARWAARDPGIIVDPRLAHLAR